MSADETIAARLTARLNDAVEHLLLAGATPWDVDEAMVAFGFRIGPCEAIDLAGLETVRAERKRSPSDLLGPPLTILSRMVEEGRIGKRGSVGFYRYPGGGGAVIDPLVEDLIAEEARYAGVTRRDIAHDEIKRALLAAMRAEAAALLDEGVAPSPADIDRISVERLGFPAAKGGLMSRTEQTASGATAEYAGGLADDDPGSPAKAEISGRS